MNIPADSETSSLDRLAKPDQHLEGLTALATEAFQQGDLLAALKYADRALRVDPTCTIIRLLCTTVLLRLNRAADALKLLDRPPPPEWIIDQDLVRITVLRALGNDAAAATVLEELLTAFALDSLAALVEPFAQDFSAGPDCYLGCVGWSADGLVTGQIRSDAFDTLSVVDLTTHHYEESPAISFRALHDWDGILTFRIVFPPGIMPTRFAVRSDAGQIIGGETMFWPPPFRFEGQVARTDDNYLEGTASCAWARDTPITLILSEETGASVWLTATPGDSPRDPQTFSVALDEIGFDGSPVTVSARLGGGFLVDLAGSPAAATLPTEPEPVPVSLPVCWDAKLAPAAKVSVIVPVYAGEAETLACLESVLSTIDPAEVELIVIEDASPEPSLVAALKELADAGRIRLRSNPRNLGFPGSVNLGMLISRDRDVVLLNADAEVYPGWLERLRTAAYSAPDIATVTPFSNSGTIMAYPGGEDSDCDSWTAAAYDMLTQQINARQIADIPSGVGFCLYIRRDCLNDVGLFNEAIFGRGYGEENDFCMRARKRGWRDIAALDVFVRHTGGRSFGRLKSFTAEHHLRIVNRLHPGYDAYVAGFLDADPLQPYRRALDIARIQQEPVETVLLITLSPDGGVAQHIETRVQALTEAGYRVLELRPEKPQHGRSNCRLTDGTANFGDLVFLIPDEQDVLTGLLRDSGVARIELHHFLGLPPELLKLPRDLDVPYDVYVHDYTWICPRITLIGGSKTYCGEPAVAVCETCIATHGHRLDKTITVRGLRDRSAGLFERAVRTVVPSNDVAARLRRYFPSIRTEIVPWEDRFLDRTLPALRANGRIRVAIIGAIGEHKGYLVLRDCARDAAIRDLPLEFVVIGFSENDYKLFETGRVHLTGRFGSGEAAELIAREKPDIAFFPSVWPETWCYALTEAERASLPIMAFDIGTVAERMAEMKHTRTIDLKLTPPAINDALLKFAGEMREVAAAAPQPKAEVTVHVPHRGNVRFEAEDWQDCFQNLQTIDAVAISGESPDLQNGIDYRGLTRSGIDTGWVKAGEWCGMRGGADPLVGLAVRLSPAFAERFRGEIYAAFQSGNVMQERRNGRMCKSTLDIDPLIGLQINLKLRQPIVVDDQPFDQERRRAR